MNKKAKPNNPEVVCLVDKQVLPLGKKCTRILEVGITAPAIENSQSNPHLNLSVVVDRSGSMSGEKLHYAKQAAAHLIDLLGEKDRAAVVMYDSRVDIVSHSREMSPTNKTLVKTEIQRIFSRGSTALFDGWLKGCEQVAENTSEGLNRTLLLSDGLANSGLTDIDEIASHARELFGRGVSTSCFGIGTNYNEHLLEAMSNAGEGNFHFLEALSAIPIAFEREFEELINISLQDVEITLELPDFVDCEVSAGWPSVKNGQTLTTTLGNLYSGRLQTIYLQLLIDAKSDMENLSLPLMLKARTMDDEAIQIEQTVDFKFIEAAEEEKIESDPDLMERFALVDMADRATEALKRARAGDRTGANTILGQSMNRHRRNMPAAMQGKYDYMSREISEGMNESSYKRHHQEEYSNKRARMDTRDYHLREINGHLITQIENQQVLIDTGIPVSMGRKSEWYFMHAVHPLSESYLGVTLEQISDLVGAPADILMGSDILKKYSILFGLERERVSFSPRPLLRNRYQFPLSFLMGVPGVHVDVFDQPCEMYLDTGAKLSYVSSELAKGLKSTGKEKDFYPGLGEFETEVYVVDFSLGDLVFTLRCGVLPSILETALKVSSKQGIIGVEFFRKYGVQLDFPRKIMSLNSSAFN
jgi:Ca-activated chloride channel family protein